jgi:hypothetical protein
MSFLSVNDVIKWNMTKEETQLAYAEGLLCPIDGKSAVRGYGPEREKKKAMDHFIGSVGELVGNLQFFTLEDYKQKRKESRQNKYKGDGGSDTPGYKIDYKGRNSKNFDPLSLYFAIRPSERHKGNIYVHIAVQTFDLSPQELAYGNAKPVAYIIGWIRDEEIDARATRDKDGSYGPRDGEGAAYKIGSSKLNRIKTLKIQHIKRTEQLVY